MTFCHYQESLSPHVMPFMRALVARLGDDEVRYIYTQDMESGRHALGWNEEERPKWTLDLRKDPHEAYEWLEKCPCLMSGCRAFDLFERRTERFLPTFYSGEKWFKRIFPFHGRVSLPGSLRLFFPRYFRMAHRIQKLLCGRAPFYYLPTGIWAARDMVRLMSWLVGDFRTLHVTCQREPWGMVRNRGKILDRIRLTGYFVAPSKGRLRRTVVQESAPLKILWVGRLLDWKRVDTIIHAVLEHNRLKNNDGDMPDMFADIYGDGPMEKVLRKFAAEHEDVIRFHPSVSIDSVRNLMQEHDVYVFSSNAYEGWGAVVNEALEEGMHVLGTFEAGSSATMLEDNDLFHVGDWRRLQTLLERCLDEKRRGVLNGQGIGEWSAEKAVDRFLALIKEVQC